jgi:hypothetical protein
MVCSMTAKRVLNYPSFRPPMLECPERVQEMNLRRTWNVPRCPRSASISDLLAVPLGILIAPMLVIEPKSNYSWQIDVHLLNT